MTKLNLYELLIERHTLLQYMKEVIIPLYPIFTEGKIIVVKKAECKINKIQEYNSYTTIIRSTKTNFIYNCIKYSSSKSWFNMFCEKADGLKSEEVITKVFGKYIPAECRSGVIIPHEILNLREYKKVDKKELIPMMSSYEKIFNSIMNAPCDVIIKHPTGRNMKSKINENYIEINWTSVFHQVKKIKSFLEINGDLQRMDLPLDLIKLAKNIGCKFSIGGEKVNALILARMANLEKKDVLEYGGKYDKA